MTRKNFYERHYIAINSMLGIALAAVLGILLAMVLS